MLSALVAAYPATSQDASPSAAESPTVEKLTSAQFVNPLPQNPQWRVIGDCMMEQAEARGIPFTETGPTGSALDATVMIQQIQQATANEVGAIITLPASDAFTPVLEQAQAAGIITATMYSGSSAAESGANVNTGLNWEDTGALYAKTVAERGGEQVVGLIAAGNTGTGKAWLDGFKAAAEQYPNVKVGGEAYTNDEAAKALDVATALLTAHPDITMLATHMGTATAGMVAAIKGKDLLGKVDFIGNGAAVGGDLALEEGYAYRVILQDLCGEAKAVMNAVADIANGETVSDQIDVPVEMVTKDDYEDYLAEGWA